MIFIRSSVWLLGALLSFTSVGNSRDADPTEDFCCLSGHMMAQKDDMLYIAGGHMQYTSEYASYDGPNPVLRSLNVSKSFQTSLDTTTYIRKEEVPGEVSTVADSAVFFPTDSGFDLTFGIWSPCKSSVCEKRDAPIEDKKWQYGIATQKWTITDVTLKNWFQTNSPRRVASSMTAWIPSLKRGFLFGGLFFWVNGTSFEVKELEEHNGLITYDQATNTWTNETTPLGGVAEAGLVHITTATDEVLIQLGGRTDWVSNIRPFSEIGIYSTNQSKWYTQSLPGEALVPTPRFAFCTALKSASDGSSHQIYIMGGLEGGASGATGGSTVDSVWVLSIPSFEWAQLPVTAETTAADPRARIAPKCQAIGEHYIFYYGGRNTLGYSATVTCDKNAKAAFLLDVNALKWTDEFIPNKGTYEIPSKVLDLIGGDKNGGSAKKEPANGWSDPGLAAIMALKTSSHRGSDSGSGSSKTNVGAIVGGAVGGVVAVLLGLVGVVMLRRRRQRVSELPSNPSKSEGPVEIMDHNQVGGGRALATELPANGGGALTPELPAGEVAVEMETRRGSG